MVLRALRGMGNWEWIECTLSESTKELFWLWGWLSALHSICMYDGTKSEAGLFPLSDLQLKLARSFSPILEKIAEYITA